MPFMLQVYMVWQRHENNYRFTKSFLSQHNYWSICDNYTKNVKLSKMLYLINIGTPSLWDWYLRLKL